MATILEKLNAYFAANTREKILEDWKRTEEFDDVGITAQEFMDSLIN